MTFDFLFYIYTGLLAFYTLIGLFFWSRTTPAYRIMVVNIAFAMVTEIAAWLVVTKGWMINNFMIFMPYMCGSFVLYMFFFKLDTRDRLLHIASWCTAVFMPLFMLVNYFLLQDPGRFASNVVVLGSVFLIGACLRTLYLTMKNADEVSIYEKNGFWMSTTILIYYTLLVLHISFVNYRTDNLLGREADQVIEISFRYLNVLFYLALNLIFIKELLFSPQPGEQKQEV